MREILFKAKRRKDYGNPKEWVYGVPCLDNDGDWTIVTHNMSRVVQDETICQYTGCLDKDGNKIFENDILFSIKEDKTGIVQWFEEYLAFMIWCESDNTVYWLYDNDFELVKVIGNKYDNMERVK